MRACNPGLAVVFFSFPLNMMAESSPREFPVSRFQFLALQTQIENWKINVQLRIDNGGSKAILRVQ